MLFVDYLWYEPIVQAVLVIHGLYPRFCLFKVQKNTPKFIIRGLSLA